MPFAYDAFMDYRMGAAVFSAKMLAVLRRRLGGEVVTKENSGLTAREWIEMEKTLEG